MRAKIAHDPVLLTKKHVAVKHLPGGDYCGMVTKKGSLYEITIFDGHSKEVFQTSRLFRKVHYKRFERSVKTHEVSHVLAGTLDQPFPVQNFVAQYIDNVLADDHDEYNLMEKYPYYARDTQMLLACLKWATPRQIDGTRLQTDLNTLFAMARFGVVRSGADPLFVRVALAAVVSSRRGDRANTIDAGIALYEYLYAKAQEDDQGGADWAKAMQYGKQQQVVISDRELDEILGSAIVAGTSILDAAKNLDGDDDTSPYNYPGTDGPEPDDAELDDEFYTSVLQMYSDVILGVRNAFLQRKRKVKRVAAMEGEIHYKPHLKRRAYLASLRGEETRTYLGLKKDKLDIEIVWFRDTSDSIDDPRKPWGKVEYARTMVVSLAALEGIEGVRQALVDFNSYYNVVMHFGDEVSRTRVYPAASGGTVLEGALNEVDEWKWTAKERYAVIITDGDIYQWYQVVLPHLQRWIANGIKVLLVEVVIDEGIDEIQGIAGNSIPGSFATTIERLPEKVGNWLASQV